MTDLLRLRILSDDAAPAAARRAIDLLGAAFGDRIDDVRMAVGELVNNSRVHGRPLEDGTVELVVATRGGVHRVEVSDGGGAGLPVASSDTSPDRLGGRGLALVSRIAARWGYVRGAGTKAWFEVGNASPQPVDPNEAMERIDQTMATAHPDTVAAAACELLVEIMDIGSVEFYRRGAGGELEIVAAAAAGNASFPARPPDPSPGLAAAVLGGDGGLVSVADGRIRALPVAHGGNRVGALVCSGPPPPYEVPVVVVSHLAAEVGRAHARVAIGRDQGRLVRDLRFLAEASAVLSSSLDYEHTLQRVAQLVVPARADWCTVNLVEPDGAIRRVAAEHRDPAARPRLAELLDRSPHDPDAPTGVPRVIATGEAALFAEVPDRLLEETANDPGYLQITRDLAIRSCVIVPLVAHGTVLGTISMVSTDPTVLRYDGTDLSVAADLGHLAGLAIANARRFRDRAAVARALQATLLPEELPAVAGLDVAVAYRPAATDLEIGGDFYDLLPGRDGAWYAVVGDVQGKGAEAATLIGLSRHTVRGAALRGASPVEALAGLNLALLAAPGSRTCTAVCLRLRPGTEGGWDVEAARAGHPAPLVMLPGRTAVRLEAAGTLLGAFDDPRLTETVVTLEAGAAIVLYTDGALARDAVSDDAVARAAAGSRDAAGIAAAVAAGADGTDDTAVLVLVPVMPS